MARLLSRPGLVSAGLIAGTSLGAGIFALPYLASSAGIVQVALYLLVLGALVTYAHTLYWRVLRDQPAETHLLELVRVHFSAGAAKATFIATILGLVFTLSAYLVLGSTFAASILGLSIPYALLLFWAACSLPLLLRLRRLVQVELAVTALLGLLIIVLFATVPVSLARFPTGGWAFSLIPFGPILFALAGWTAIEPALAAVRGRRGYRRIALGWGTGLVAVSYVLFALSLGSAGDPVTTDTISGVLHLPGWQVGALFALGLAAIVTSYLPMILEVKNAFRRGLGWPRSWAFPVAVFLPYLLVLAGFDSFLSSLELVGGVFLAAQYVAILQVCRRALRLRGAERIAADIVSAAFALAALLHIAYFVAPYLGLG